MYLEIKNRLNNYKGIAGGKKFLYPVATIINELQQLKENQYDDNSLMSGFSSTSLSK